MGMSSVDIQSLQLVTQFSAFIEMLQDPKGFKSLLDQAQAVQAEQMKLLKFKANEKDADKYLESAKISDEQAYAKLQAAEAESVAAKAAWEKELALMKQGIAELKAELTAKLASVKEKEQAANEKLAQAEADAKQSKLVFDANTRTAEALSAKEAELEDKAAKLKALLE